MSDKITAIRDWSIVTLASLGVVVAIASALAGASCLKANLDGKPHDHPAVRMYGERHEPTPAQAEVIRQREKLAEEAARLQIRPAD